jgi:hypothetical protein
MTKKISSLKKRMELERMFDWVGPFKKGLAPARKNGQWFHITHDGRPAYGARFAWVGRFNDSGAYADATDGEGNVFEIDRKGFKRKREYRKVI